MKEKATNLVVDLILVVGLFFMFAPLFITNGEFVIVDMLMSIEDPVLFLFSLMFFLMFLWSLSFYLEKRKELRVAKKIIRRYATQGKVVPHLNGECKRLDEVLLKAIWELKIGEEVTGVIDRLQEGTQRGEALPEGGARNHYATAIDHLTDAAGRDWVLAWEERERDLLVGEKMLWATRAENMRCLMRGLLTCT